MTALNVHQLALRARGMPDQAMTFSIADGEIAALFGRPGSGIRQVMRTIAGLEPVATGEVRVGDMPVHSLPANRRRIGFVQRDSALFAGNVRDNVAFGLKRVRWPKGDRSRRIAEVLELVGMTGAEDDPIEVLTEGERARVILARAIAPKPAALLVESPTWFVPDVDKIAFRGRLREVFQSLEIPILVSTNDVQDAVGVADDLLVMHEGVLKQSGSVSRVLAGPNSIETAELVGYVTLIRGEVSDGWILEPGAGAIEFPTGFPLQGIARAMAHPAVMLGVPESSGLGCGVAGTLERVRAIGPTHLLDIRVGERIIEVRWEWDLNPPDGEEAIAIAVTPGTLRFFNEPTSQRPAGTPELSAGHEEDEEREAEPGPTSGTVPASATAQGAVTSTWTSSEGVAGRAGGTADDEREAGAPRFASTSTTETATDTAPQLRPGAETREFTPSDGLMAEPAPVSLDPPEITYAPRDTSGGDEEFVSGSPFPAPAPPRSQAASSGPSTEAQPADDDSVELMAPWLQVSRPARDEEDQPDRSPDPHRGMPLD